MSSNCNSPHHLPPTNSQAAIQRAGRTRLPPANREYLLNSNSSKTKAPYCLTRVMYLNEESGGPSLATSPHSIQQYFWMASWERCFQSFIHKNRALCNVAFEVKATYRCINVSRNITGNNANACCGRPLQSPLLHATLNMAIVSSVACVCQHGLPPPSACCTAASSVVAAEMRRELHLALRAASNEPILGLYSCAMG